MKSNRTTRCSSAARRPKSSSGSRHELIDSATDSSAWNRAARVVPPVDAMASDSDESSSFFAILSDDTPSARGTGDAI